MSENRRDLRNFGFGHSFGRTAYKPTKPSKIDITSFAGVWRCNDKWIENSGTAYDILVDIGKRVLGISDTPKIIRSTAMNSIAFDNNERIAIFRGIDFEKLNITEFDSIKFCEKYHLLDIIPIVSESQ
jgi:hypothetical protein